MNKVINNLFTTYNNFIINTFTLNFSLSRIIINSLHSLLTATICISLTYFSSFNAEAISSIGESFIITVCARSTNKSSSAHTSGSQSAIKTVLPPLLSRELDQETNNLLVSLFSETQFHLLDVSSHGSDLTTENYAVPAHTILPVVLHSLPD